MLSLNEQKAICAQQENPFVENKPYNPDTILSFVVTHLMDGFAPAPGDSEAADYAKQLYIAAIQTLHELDMSINEQSIVKMRDEIIARVSTKEDATTPAATIEEKPACYVADLKESDGGASPSIQFNVAGKSLIVKKQWIQWAVIALIILILIKIFR
jgi:hypothetical protein